MASTLSEASWLGQSVGRASRVPRGSLRDSPGVPATCCGEQQWSLTRSWKQRCHHPGWSGPACPGHSGTWLGEHRHTEGQSSQLGLPSPIPQRPKSQSPHQGQNVPSCQHLLLPPRASAAAVEMRGPLAPLLLIPWAYGGGGNISAGDIMRGELVKGQSRRLAHSQ